METTRTKTIDPEFTFSQFTDVDDDHRISKERLEKLLKINTEFARQEELFKTEKEKVEADLILNPLNNEKAFSYFGLLIGSIPPATIFLKFLLESPNLRSEDSWITLLLAFVVLVTSLTGYFSGKLIGKIITEVDKLSWSKMLLALPFIGLLWGIISGGAGGIFIFVIGVVFGAVIGGAVGAVALSVFASLHRIFKRGDVIDRKIFLPLAYGITFIISAFIIGL